MASEQEKTLQALETAIRMEIDGKEYYLKAAGESRNEVGKRLFQTLAREEDSHRLKFEEIYRDIRRAKDWPEAAFTPHARGELKTLFAEASGNIQSTETELEAVKAAREMEVRTRDFYRERAGKAAFEAEKKYYEALAGEEQVHHLVLNDYFEYLKNPAGWFTMKERHSLDGG